MRHFDNEEGSAFWGSASPSSFQYCLDRPRLSKATCSNDRSRAISENRVLTVTASSDPVSFVTASSAHLELVFPNGSRIAVPSGFDTRSLPAFHPIVEEPPGPSSSPGNRRKNGLKRLEGAHVRSFAALRLSWAAGVTNCR